jgi:CobQ/CobB/MinD/ParA nucleotide binding domain
MNSQVTTSNIPIVNIVSYSYKGGSGRSTGSVNIAFELARRGKLVVCLDMDVGAAGLHMIMSEWRPEAKKKVDANSEQIGHQDFLNARDPSRDEFERLAPALLDVTSDVGRRFIPGEGRLLFLFSGTRSRALNDLSRGPQGAKAFEDKYRLLQQWLANKIRGTDRQDEVYFIIDAPNGITPVSLPLLKSADLILMFYRHSLQHIRGTIEAGHKLHYYLMEEVDRRYMRILLVGSCVPTRLINSIREARMTGQFPEGDYGHDMAEKFEEMTNNLDAFAHMYRNVVVRLDDEIVEDDVLKVLEQPLTSDGVRNLHLGYPVEGWDEMSSAETRARIGRISNSIAEYGPEVIRRKNRMFGRD